MMLIEVDRTGMRTHVYPLIILLLLAGCLSSNSAQGGQGPVMVASQAPLIVETSASHIAVIDAEASQPVMNESPDTPAPQPLLLSIEQEITEDLVGRSLAIAGVYSYTVKPQDIRKIERTVLDGTLLWKATVVASNASAPYAWFVYYTKDGVLYKVNKQFS